MSLRSLSRTLLVSVCAVALIATTPQGNYCQSRAQIVTLVTGGLLTWKTTQPSGWATDNTEVTYTDFVNNIANTGSCTQPGGSPNGLINWSLMIACAQNHTVSQQNVSAAGSYTGPYYTAAHPGTSYICISHPGSGVMKVTLPAGTVAPTSSATQLTLSLSGISYAVSTQLSAQLYNPSGVAVGVPVATNGPTLTASYSGTGAPAGAWYWQISSSGAPGETCDSVDGVQGSTDSASWSGTAYYYQ